MNFDLPPKIPRTVPEPAFRPPVVQLLTLGAGDPAAPWPDDAALGISPAHIADLIRTATGRALHEAPSDSAEVWAVHAWQALAARLWPPRTGRHPGPGALSPGPPAWAGGPGRGGAQPGGDRLPASRRPGRVLVVLRLALARHTTEAADFHGFVVSLEIDLKAVEAVSDIDAPARPRR